MNIKLSEIYSELKNFHPSLVTKFNEQADDIDINQVVSIEKALSQKNSKGCLVFCGDFKKITELKEAGVSAVITKEAPEIENIEHENKSIAFIRVSNLDLALHVVKSAIFDSDPFLNGSQIHETAIISKNTQLPEKIWIGPYVIIGDYVKIGEGSVIGAGSIIEDYAEIGKNAVFQPKVFIGHHCQIGNNVRMQSGTLIGMEGFGYAQDEHKKNHRIPQTGIVVIEDDVHLGSYNCVDRASFDETRICRGVISDNFVHVGHNCTIGEDCILIAFTGISGSTTFGKRVIASGATGVLDHVNVTSDVILVHRAGVIGDIRKPGVYAGSPIQPIDEYMKNQAAFRTLHKLRKNIKSLENRIAELEKKPTS